MKNGFVKVAAASPVIRVADTVYNAARVIDTIQTANAQGVRVLVFPELTLTGCSCRDLFRHRVLLDGAKEALVRVTEATAGADMLVFVGLPLAVGSRVYSVAAAIHDGTVLALIPGTHAAGTPFSVPAEADTAVEIGGQLTAVVTEGALFTSAVLPELKVAVELGADLDALDSPAAAAAKAGATVIAQMASFPASVTSREEAELQIRFESRRMRSGIVLAAPGKGESTTDRVFSGLCLVAEAGTILSADEKADSFAVSEVDVEYMTNLRRGYEEFDTGNGFSSFDWGIACTETALTRKYRMHPHLPESADKLPAYCERMLDIQVSGLVKRMEYAHLDHCVVGISGGVDSTLAVMVSAMAVKRMGLPTTNVVACTLPCFGTSSRTKSNAIIVAEQIGAEVRVIDIGKAVYQHFDDIGHAHDDYSVAYENAQARERTQVLMDIANKVNGLDVGTEDLSEFIDGWCTYNGDHTSMYDVNMGLTKTQVRANVRYIADTTEDRVLKAALYDVLECPVTPELLPIHDDQIEQKSEEAVGSYSLQDFFTHKMLICGFTPSKTFRLAKIAYANEFTDEELVRWLTSYCRRLFSQQFKRSCLMDGPAVEAFSVSPRDGFLIPSDAECALFLKDLEQISHS
ncbi:MAG: NAD(+) synthase [Oscillospiraceae bacterium]|nr:NAD(+) synthase [Oscillospiraceae bacterium]